MRHREGIVSIDYIRKAYGLDLKVGEQVRIKPGCGAASAGKRGKLVRARGQYLVVKGNGWDGHFHPGDVERAACDTTKGGGA
jgi:hypothetical protein